MVTLKTALIIFYCIILLGFLSACENEKESSSESFLIKVESIEIPNNIVADESVNLAFFGTVGTNGCYQFSKFKTDDQGHEIIVEVWGNMIRPLKSVQM